MPAGEVPTEIRSASSSRNHESYVVKVGHNSLYWPRVSHLQAADKSGTAENVLIAERDREWGVALADIDVAARSTSVRHGDIVVARAEEVCYVKSAGTKEPLSGKEWAAGTTQTNGTLETKRNEEKK